MARKVKVVINSSAVAELLSSDALLNDITARAEAIADSANSKSEAGAFKAQAWVAGGSSKLSRAMARVVTANSAGRKSQSENETLQRSLGAGRG